MHNITDPHGISYTRPLAQPAMWLYKFVSWSHVIEAHHLDTLCYYTLRPSYMADSSDTGAYDVVRGKQNKFQPHPPEAMLNKEP